MQRCFGLLWLVAVAAACGSSGSPAKSRVVDPITVPPPPSAVDESARHEELAAAHRKIEGEQQEALAATCDVAKPQDAHERCVPSCYATEHADPRAGKKLGGAAEIMHLACVSAGAGSDTGPFVIADEIEPAKLALRPVRSRFPRGHAKGTWQAAVESALVAAQHVARGDVIVVAGGWRTLTHPLTREPLRCVAFSQYVRSMHHALDACGATGALACEAIGNAAARGINVVHYRLAEARSLQAAGKTSECQQAALEAIAVARGMPRWRQYSKLNARTWIDHPAYRTRFDGTLDEDTLFANATTLGGEALAVFAACGGPAAATTAVDQEQSFHTCW